MKTIELLGISFNPKSVDDWIGLAALIATIIVIFKL